MTEAAVPQHGLTSRLYLLVWIVLVALTAATVAVARMNVTAFAALISIGIATVKAGLVLVFFMHLKHEPLILKVMLGIALLALSLIILLTFSDVWYRWGAHVHS